MNVETLATDGFVAVAYPQDLRICVQEAMDSWKSFCELPIQEKRKLSGGNRLRDFGYMLREDSGPRADKKELFHVLRRQMAELKMQAQEIPDLRATAFIDAVDALLSASVSLVQEFASAVERQYGLVGFEDEVARSSDNWTFRYLHYFGGDMLAHPHTDRGGFTLHLHESHSGGEYLDFDGVWRPWPVSERQTIIFPSMGMQYRSDGKLKALCHRVRPNEETVQDGRYSMVAFVDFSCSHRFDDARWRTQDFEPGFNYPMSMEKFKDLFVPC